MAEKVRGKADREIKDTSCDRLCQKRNNVERGEQEQEPKKTERKGGWTKAGDTGKKRDMTLSCFPVGVSHSIYYYTHLLSQKR